MSGGFGSRDDDRDRPRGSDESCDKPCDEPCDEPRDGGTYEGAESCDDRGYSSRCCVSNFFPRSFCALDWPFWVEKNESADKVRVHWDRYRYRCSYYYHQ